MPTRFSALLFYIFFGLLFTACGGEDGSRVSAHFSIRATVEQIYLWNTDAGSEFEVVTAEDVVLATGATDEMGGKVFRQLPPGEGYKIRPVADPDDYTGPLTVLSVEQSVPDEDLYASQILTEGFQYLTMRDGTQLSAFVWLPGPPEDGPYPTIVNISGYSPSQPGQSLGTDLEFLCGSYPVVCNAPSHPSGLIGGFMGYASVGVNLRGTGCSGGAYDYFEPLQLIDGYDVIEIVSRQSWVKHNKVGMAGLSFPGITQLFIAKMHPPGLAAISPMSVIADTTSSCLMPGGIYNNGFALSWIENVLDKAAPYAHQWITDRVEAGDTLCEENQKLHAQKLDAVSKALENPYYTDEVAKPVDPSTFVDQINVPVYNSGHWQDEQTGPHFATFWDKFNNAPKTRFVATNGVHADGYAAQQLTEWKIFLDLYVARQVPILPADLVGLAPMFFDFIYGTSLELPANRFADYTSYEQALADYEAEPSVRIVFESGADPAYAPGAPDGTFAVEFDRWPHPDTQARRWYFQPGGLLADEAPDTEGGMSRFVHEAAAGSRTFLNSRNSINDPQPDYDYRPLVEGHAVAFESAPLEEDLVMIGTGSADLWLSSTATDADLEVNLTEIRPDGMESYVQGGTLRASHRALRDDATELRPVKSHYEADVEPLVPGTWHEARVEIMPFAHIFRAGSRIRISVDTPGDAKSWWFFILLDQDPAPTHSIGHHAEHPSSIVLPIIPGIEVPTDMPDCHALRGQPCREYVPYVNDED
ncbi:MAG: CocE/NonD family hydrolase [Deltaproteobacteria bacterium]|nr:CocE/NonD family hydrolase [Deltaproteobacteria bacterium]